MKYFMSTAVLLQILTLCLAQDPTQALWGIPVKDCRLETHPTDDRMFITRSPLGQPLERTCPPSTYFIQDLCACVTKSEKCNLRASSEGPMFYEEYIFGMWLKRPCGPGSAFNPTSCDCSSFY